MKKTKIVVVGSFNADMTALTPKFPVGGETIMGKSFTVGAGGKGTNQAISAANCGSDVCMIAKIGTDVLSDIARNVFQGAGISMDTVFVTDEASTGCAVIEVSEESGENKIIVIPGANAMLTAKDVESVGDKIRDCDILLTQLETTLESVEAALKIASDSGRVTVLNPAPYADIPSSWFKMIDYFIPNETETEYFTGIRVEDEASAQKAATVLIEKGVKNVIITMGKKGSFFFDGKESFTVPATESKAVDTTGAGDCFCGAFCTALGEGMSVRDALRFANCAAGISVTRLGASASMPSREEIELVFNS